MLALLPALTGAAPAQGTVAPVFHVYVDPIFGDDALAATHNPGPTLPFAPFTTHPDAAADFPNEVPHGLIRQAPYSFRTLTGTKAYLDAVEAPLIHNSAIVVIHCLPGLYGPTLSAPQDPRSGLVYNGETWPFLLRWNWSLQGTSALDTIFDAREQPTALVVVQAQNFQQLSHRDSIIDSLTLRGARVNGEPMSPNNGTGAGVYIVGTAISGGRGVQIGVTVSNCFIVDNHVGVAIDNPLPSKSQWISDPRIVNCTFARNWIGLWSGDRDPLALENKGWATPILLNNIFDQWRPDVPYSGTTPFVGIHPYEIAVGALYMVQGGGGGWVDLNPIVSYCAWEAGRENYAVALPGWPVPGLQGPGVAFPPPRVDIGSHIGKSGLQARGILYINDLFRVAGIQAVPGVDYSPHDYRLAPTVRKDPLETAPGELNPLVNKGIRLWYSNPLGESIDGIRMARRRFNAPPLPPPDDLLRPPGPAGIEPYATLDAWDLDCEGFGNPRGIDRSYFPLPTGRFDTNMDIGADEMDELIIAGYIDSTRVLGKGTTLLAGDHQRLYFVNVAGTGPWLRPLFNVIDGKTYKWWDHVQGAPDGALGTNYTAGVPNSRRAQLRIDFSKPLFMRNLECDFSPHLMADPHPLWWFGFLPLPQQVPDIYACNPWWWHDAPPAGPAFRHDNGALYDNIDPLWSLHGSNNVIRNPFGMDRTTILSGTINPPGTGLTSTALGLQYLHPAYAMGQFLSVFPCQGGVGPFYTVDTWGLGDAGANCPDIVPTLGDERGLRGNFQVLDSAWHNLQTLLSTKGPATPVGESMLRSPTPEAALRHGRMVDELLRRR